MSSSLGRRGGWWRRWHGREMPWTLAMSASLDSAFVGCCGAHRVHRQAIHLNINARVTSVFHDNLPVDRARIRMPVDHASAIVLHSTKRDDRALSCSGPPPCFANGSSYSPMRRMPEPKMRHIISVQRTRRIRFHVPTIERPTNRPQVREAVC